MYCTTKGWLDLSVIGGINLINEISKYIEIKEHGTNDNGRFVRGEHKGLKINVCETGLGFYGSLCKSKHKNNLASYNRLEVKETFGMLSEGLHLPMEKSKITRIDPAGNLYLNHSPANYYPFLGKCKYFERWSRKNTLYYSKAQKVLALYDKIVEMRKAGGIPSNLDGQNVLRYEMRLLGKLCQELKVNEVNAAMLYDVDFFKMIVNKWANEYYSIVKVNCISQNHFQEMKTVNRKDLIEGFALMAIRLSGNPSIINETIDNLYAIGKIKNRTEKFRMKTDINNLLSRANLNDKNELIEELDKKIDLAKEHYLNTF